MLHSTFVIFKDKRIKKLMLFLTVFLSFIPFLSYSTHIVGGELNYTCLGGNQYQIKLRVYRDCYTGVPPFDNPAAVGIFDNNNVLVTTVYLPFPGSTVLPPTVAQANVCVKTPTNICVEVAEYVGTVTLPPRVGGYQLAYQRCCRNPTINNLTNPGNQGATYYARIPDQSYACNSNPVFTNWPPIFVCANNQILFDHSATDADGDVIVYSLCNPFNGATSGSSQPQPPNAPPYTSVTWRAPYSATNPLGGNTLTIDPNTGLMSGTPTTLGQYVVGVCADEYRGGVLISTTKRDFQFNVINCQPDIVAASVHAYTNCTTRTVTFTNNSTGTNTFFWDFGDLTTLGDTSNLQNPTYNYPALGTYTVTLIAFSGINSSCNDTLKNYVVNVTACPPCTMTLGISKVDATCGGGAGTGCTHIIYPVTCTSNFQYNSYGTGSGSTSGTCSSGSGSGNIGTGSPTTPNTINIVVNGTVMPATNPPVPPATVTVTGVTQATCPKTATYSYVGGVITFDYYLWLGATPTLGSATVTSSGGTGPYTYSWAPSGGTGATASNLSAGSYTVTVTDAGGCQRTASTYINSTSAMTVTVNQTPLSACGASDATATAVPASGVGPYTYLWSNGQTTATATGLSVGVYSVIVYDNGCSLSRTITIVQPVTINPGISKTDVTCNGNNGTATATPTGGAGPYTYSWSTIPIQTTATATGLFAGAYSVTVTDAGGCTGTASITLVDNSLTLSSSFTNINCGGSGNGTATITATGGSSPYTYSWNTTPGQTTVGATGLQGGSYIGTVVDALGCTDTVMVDIIEPSPLLPEPKNTSTINCAGVTTGSAHVDVSGGVPGFTYLWSNGGTTQDITGLSAGTYTITITDSRGCTGQNTINVTPPAPLNLSYFPSNITGCNGDNTGSVIIIPAGGNPGYTYLWNTSPAQTTQSISGLTAGTYTVTVTDITGCTASLGNVVISEPTIVSLTTANSPVGCTINNGTASVTASGGTAGYTYSWMPSGNTTSTISGLSTGTYTVTVTDANGCTQTSSVNLSTSTSPTGNIVSQSNVGCTGSATGSATVTAGGGTPGYTYSWNPGGQTTATVSGLTSGSYNVTITDTNGCTVLQNVAITQPASSVSALTSSTNAACGGSNGTATVTGSGGTGSLTYVWSPTGQTTTTAINLSSGSYNVTVTDANGCTASSAVSVNNSNGPTVGISSQTNVLCNGSGTGSATITTSGGTGMLTYVWTPGGQTTTTVTGLTAGTYIVTVTDSNSCAQGQTIIITEPSSAINSGISSLNNVGCTGNSTGSVTITATGGTGTLIYNWSPGGQTTSIISGLTAGTYSITVTDANGCSQQQQVTITEPNSVLSSGISNQSNVSCTGGTTGSAMVTATGGTIPYTYGWNTGGTIDNITGLTAGTYSVTITDANGCSQLQTVTITEPASAINIIPSSTNAACGSSNGTVSITASGGTPGYIYNWSTGHTTTTVIGLTAGTYSVSISDNNGCTQAAIVTVNGSPGPSASVSSTNITCNGSNDGSITVTAISGTLPYTYTWNPNVTTNNTISGLSANTYTVIVTDVAGCSSTVQATITQPIPFTLTITSSGTICAGESVTLSVTPNGGNGPFIYTWTPSGPMVSPLVPTTFFVTGTDSSGCISTIDSIIITPLSSPIAGFDTISSGTFNQIYRFTDISTGGNSWYWILGDGTTTTLQNPFHTYTAGTYTVTQVVINSVTGCSDTVTKVIVILPRITIPNVFTPNNDGINDDFWIPNTGFENFELNIYDRWGLKLFSTNSGEIRWDGRTAAGQPVPDGTYYYLLTGILSDQNGGKEYNAQGFINLVRGGGK